MTFRVLIIDDEPLARKGVMLRLQSQADFEVIGECDEGSQAIAAILSLKPDLVFLDVQLPGVSGLQVLEAIPQEELPFIIFLTAFDEYAIAAFEVQAIDYLLKPIDDERFQVALERVRRSSNLQQHQMLYHRLSELLEVHSNRKSSDPIKRFAVRRGRNVTFVRAVDIDWIQAVGDYAGLHIGSKTHLLRESLDVLATRLDEGEFQRIHRSTIVQVDRIARIESLTNRDCRVTLHNGTSLRVSRTFSRSLYARLRNVPHVAPP